MISFRRLPYLEYWLNRGRVRKQLSERTEDILMTQGLEGAAAVGSFKGRSVYFVRDEYYLNKIPIYQTGIKKLLKYIYILIQLPFILVLFRDNKKAMERAGLVVANSLFMKSAVLKKFGRECELVYSMRDIESLFSLEIPPREEREFITLVGSELMKGIDIVREIAASMPEKKFMIVGRSFSDKVTKGNIVYAPWEKDATEIYKKTHILLVPSLCNDSSPGVAVEAMALGIPVLGSNRGGIPELIGKKNIVENYNNIDNWKKQIEDVEYNYEQYSNRGVKRVGNFDYAVQVDRFKDVMKKYFDISL